MIDYDDLEIFHEINDFRRDIELLSAVKRCISAQKRIGQAKYNNDYQPNPDAPKQVSKDTLDHILDNAEDISDIRTHSDISNCIVFHTRNLDGSLVDEGVLNMRREIDRLVANRLQSLFMPSEPLAIQCSGHFWYPAGGYMGWHTNLRKPGWRFYISYADQPGKSFFRYRDPDSTDIVTVVDREWDFRLFRICPNKPFWHAVYSDTNRFSLGYMVVRKE